MLVRAIGVAACSLLVPITLAVIVVLLFVTLSYGEVVMVHTRAGLDPNTTTLVAE